MNYALLEDKISQLAEDISYPSKKTTHLEDALKLSTSKGHLFFHSGIEAVGREMREAIFRHYLYTRGYQTEKQINEALEKYKNEDYFDAYGEKHHLKDYIYNDQGFYPDIRDSLSLPENTNTILIDRIIGALYYDARWEVTKDFVICNSGIRNYKKTGSIESTK